MIDEDFTATGVVIRDSIEIGGRTAIVTQELTPEFDRECLASRVLQTHLRRFAMKAVVNLLHPQGEMTP